MNFKVFYIVLLCFSQLGLSQIPFQVTVEKEAGSGSFAGRNITEDHEGNIFAVSTGGFGLSQLHLTKVNQQGIIVWDTLYSFTPFAEFTAKIIPAHDGGVIVGSTSFSYPTNDQDSIQDILLWKINGEGKIEWQNVIESYLLEEMIPSKDGSYLILGSELDKGRNIICCKVKLDGELEWRKIVSDPNTGTWAHAFLEVNSYIYLSGQSAKITNGVSDNYIYKMDSDGNVIWQVVLRNEFSAINYIIGQLFAFGDKVYFGFDRYYELDTQTGEYEPLDSSNHFSEFSFDITCDNQELKAIRTVPEHPNTILYRKYDRIGNYTLQTEIPNIIGSTKDQVATADGGFAFISSDNTTIQITKVDCRGNVDFWSEDCKSKIRENSNALIYPNPTENILNIEASFNFEQVKIYNLRGQEVTFKTLCECNKHSIDISFLAAGLYFVIIEGETEVATERFLKI